MLNIFSCVSLEAGFKWPSTWPLPSPSDENHVWSPQSFKKLETKTSSVWKKHTAKSLQSCPTLCNPIDGSPPGSAIPGILQARTLEWVAMSFSNAWKWNVKVKSLSCVWLFATPWTAAHQAPLPMGFSRQEYWSGVPLPSPKRSNRKSHSLLLGMQNGVLLWNTVWRCLTKLN